MRFRSGTLVDNVSEIERFASAIRQGAPIDMGAVLAFLVHNASLSTANLRSALMERLRVWTKDLLLHEPSHAALWSYGSERAYVDDSWDPVTYLAAYTQPADLARMFNESYFTVAVCMVCGHARYKRPLSLKWNIESKTYVLLPPNALWANMYAMRRIPENCGFLVSLCNACAERPCPMCGTLIPWPPSYDEINARLSQNGQLCFPCSKNNLMAVQPPKPGRVELKNLMGRFKTL